MSKSTHAPNSHAFTSDLCRGGFKARAMSLYCPGFFIHRRVIRARSLRLKGFDSTETSSERSVDPHAATKKTLRLMQWAEPRPCLAET